MADDDRMEHEKLGMESLKKPARPSSSPGARQSRAEETHRVATAFVDGETEAREAKTARLKAARKEAEANGTAEVKKPKGRTT